MNNIESVKRVAQKMLSSKDILHGFPHAESTAGYAREIAESEGAPVEHCVIAAYLHDIGRGEAKEWTPDTQTSNHGVDGAELAEPILRDIGLSEEDNHIICEAISQHCFPNLSREETSFRIDESRKIQKRANPILKNAFLRA